MKTKIREKANWPVTILLILGLITVVFPLYMTIVIAFKQPTEMVGSSSPASKMCDSIEVVVVLPWVPEIAIGTS